MCLYIYVCMYLCECECVSYSIKHENSLFSLFTWYQSQREIKVKVLCNQF